MWKYMIYMIYMMYRCTRVGKKLLRPRSLLVSLCGLAGKAYLLLHIASVACKCRYPWGSWSYIAR